MKPTVIFDIGNTLLSRSAPGPFVRITSWINAKHGRAFMNDNWEATAIALLTAKSKTEALQRLKRLLSWSETEMQEAEIFLNMDEGKPQISKLALEVLGILKEKGWRIGAATNSVAWSEPLPQEIAIYLDFYCTSYETGYVKSQDRFWKVLMKIFDVSARQTLVVGDSPDSDILPAIRNGFASLEVRNCDLTQLHSYISQLTMPELDEDYLIFHPYFPIKSRRVIPMKNLSSLMSNVSRLNCSIFLPVQRREGVLVRTPDKSASLFFDSPTTFEIGTLAVGWLRIKKANNSLRIPIQLRQRLKEEGLNLNSLSNQEIKNLIATLTEAKKTEVKEKRLQAIIEFVKNGKSLQ